LIEQVAGAMNRLLVPLELGMQRPPELEEMVTMDATQLPQFHPPGALPSACTKKQKEKKVTSQSSLPHQPVGEGAGAGG